jgi:hypothetical protein
VPSKLAYALIVGHCCWVVSCAMQGCFIVIYLLLRNSTGHSPSTAVHAHLSAVPSAARQPPQRPAATRMVCLDRLDQPGPFGQWRPVWPLPPSYSSLTNLVSLDVSSNSLTGPLPPSYSSLTALTSLDVSDNFFNGGLPPAWSSLPYLSVLDVSNNPGLTGAIPPSWVGGLADSLTRLDVRGTTVCGGVPAALSPVTVADASANVACPALPPPAPSPPPPPVPDSVLLLLKVCCTYRWMDSGVLSRFLGVV